MGSALANVMSSKSPGARRRPLLCAGWPWFQAVAHQQSGLRAAIVMCCCLTAIPARAQPQLLPQEDPEDERRLGLWFDEPISIGLSGRRSLEFAFHQRLDEGGTNLFVYFFTGGMEFRPRQWLAILPAYRYMRFPGDVTTSYENRVMLTVTLTARKGRWRPNLRTRVEGRFPQNRIASARVRFRPGIEYTVPLGVKRPPVLVVNNEFFLVPGANSFTAGGKFTQNRFQAGVRIPITESLAIRPYYMVQSVNLPRRWDGNGVIGLSV